MKRGQKFYSKQQINFTSKMPFVIKPVACTVAINDDGTTAQLITGDESVMEAEYYQLHAPILSRLRHQNLHSLRRADLLGAYWLGS